MTSSTQAQKQEAVLGELFLNENQLAELFGWSARTAQRKRMEGSGPPYRKLGHFVRYSLKEALQWAEEQRRTSTSDPGPDSDRRAFVATPPRREARQHRPKAVPRQRKRRHAGAQPEAS